MPLALGLYGPKAPPWPRSAAADPTGKTCAEGYKLEAGSLHQPEGWLCLAPPTDTFFF